MKYFKFLKHLQILSDTMKVNCMKGEKIYENKILSLVASGQPNYYLC